jgi:hypothetical protein
MMRTAFGLVTLLSVGLMACSSKSVDDDDGKAGSATGGTSAAGTPATGGSNGNNTSGTGTGGAIGQSGSSSTAGTGGTPAGDGCTDTAVMCVDAETASVCDPLTGETETANCTEELAKDGLISNGCTVDEMGSGCTVDDLADADCAAGTPAFAVCADATQDELIDIYIACFHNNQDVAHEAISCYAAYADVEAGTVDCMAADAACLPEQ